MKYIHINRSLKHYFNDIYRTSTTLVKALGDKHEFYELILKYRLRWTTLEIVALGEFREYPFT